MGADLHAAPQTRVKLGSRRRLNLSIQGEGAPTVVFASGFGGTTLAWQRIQPKIAKLAKTVSYDPAGSGFSDPGPLPRDAAAMAKDLHAALNAAGLKPPYVLVAHSIAGVYMRLFAYLHPDEVAGLVMIDSSSEHQMRRMLGSGARKWLEGSLRFRRKVLAAFKAGGMTVGSRVYDQAMMGIPPGLSEPLTAAMIAQRMKPSQWRAWNSEEAALLGSSSDQVVAARDARGAKPLGDIPMIVITAGQQIITPDDPATVERTEMWRLMHREIAAQSTRAELRIVDAGHNMPTGAPAFVIAAVEEMLERVRA